MKWLPVAAAALLLTLAAAIGVWLYLANSAEALARELERVEEALAREDWAEAESGLTAVEEEWRRTRPKWAVLIDHNEMEKIDLSLVKLKSAIACREYSDAAAEEAALMFYLRHAPDTEKPGWENIF